MKNKIYSLYGKAVDVNGQEHMVTVVGVYNQQKQRFMVTEPTMVEVGFKEVNGSVSYEASTKVRTLSLGYSICHPNDEFNEAVGISVAKSRAKKEPIGEVSSTDVTMLNEDHATALVFAELRHIIKNIDKYIEK